MKVITRSTMLKKILRSLANDDKVCLKASTNDSGDFDAMQSDVENLLTFYSSKARKWIEFRQADYIPLSDFKKHYNKYSDELDNAVDDGVSEIII